MPLVNAFGDATLAVVLLYAAYQVRDHRKIAALYTIISIAFLSSAITLARELAVFDFYLVATLRMFIFSVLFSEVTKYMVKNFGRIRFAYLLYLPAIIIGLTPIFDIRALFASVFVVSSLILIITFSRILALKKGHTRIFSFFGFLGVLYSIILASTDISVIFIPWTIVFLPEKIFLIIFFVGFAYHVHCNPYSF
mgnify:CR=1 FL=1